jgi:predicted alpha/beta-fold hydrolase
MISFRESKQSVLRPSDQQDNLPSNLGNGHLETLIPYLFRPTKKQFYERERIDTPDNDFLDLDWVKVGHKDLVIISHGLESSSHAKYVQGTADHLRQNGFDILAWNYRGCSGELNRTIKYYHSGASYDLATVVEHVLESTNYETIYLVGFSLGGNLTLKYLGEESTQLSKKIKAGCVFSTPCYLKTASHELASGFNKVYTQNFVSTLRQKVYDKEEMLKENGFDTSVVKKLKDLPAFDDFFTAPLHGFKDADDYYEQCSSKFFLKDIKVPTLIVNAANDPFLSAECYPYEEAEGNPFLDLEVPEHGGHVGFYQRSRGNVMWSEARILSFLKSLQ